MRDSVRIVIISRPGGGKSRRKVTVTTLFPTRAQRQRDPPKAHAQYFTRSTQSAARRVQQTKSPAEAGPTPTRNARSELRGERLFQAHQLRQAEADRHVDELGFDVRQDRVHDADHLGRQLLEEVERRAKPSAAGASLWPAAVPETGETALADDAVALAAAPSAGGATPSPAQQPRPPRRARPAPRRRRAARPAHQGQPRGSRSAPARPASRGGNPSRRQSRQHRQQ